MDNETEDPREHIDDHEWLYQHGYYDGTLYADQRRFAEAVQAFGRTFATEIRRTWPTRIIFAPWLVSWWLLKRLNALLSRLGR